MKHHPSGHRALYFTMQSLQAARVAPRLVFQRAVPIARRAPLLTRAMASAESKLDKSTPEEVRVWCLTGRQQVAAGGRLAAQRCSPGCGMAQDGEKAVC